MATVDADVFQNHTSVSLGVLRNGPATGVTRTARESAIAAKYYYSTPRHAAALDGNAAAFSPPCPDIVILEACIRSTFSTIVEAAVDDAEAVYNANAAAGAPAYAPANDRQDNRAKATNRLEAIAVGAVRASLLISYNIVDADLIETERSACILALTAPAAGVDAAALQAAMRTTTAGWTIAVTSGNGAGNGALTEAENTALDMAALTADEAELAFALMAMGQVAPVRAGAQLFEDGHHYHSNTNSSARHRAIEREVLGRLSDPAKNLWRANTMLLRNAVWHAACHPIMTNILQGFAEDANMPERLDATGYGSFSVGLPAQEDLFSRAGSYIAVLNQVKQTATAHGHEVTLDDLVATRDALFDIGRNGALPGQRPALPGKPAAAWPNGCNTRAKVLKLFLEPALNAAEPVAAWLYGYYKEIAMQAGIRANSQEGSLLRSYSLKRALANYLGEANRAQEMYAARVRWQRAKAEEGKLVTYKGAA